MKNKDVFIIVPTLNPNIEIMDEFIDQLLKEFSNIVVVNDGCRDSYNDFFKSLEKKGVIVLKHYVNYGKGRALKTAFNYILNNYENCKCIVTADSDGQHAIKDILNCAKASLKNPNKLILGVRDFYQKNVPFERRFANILTRNVFKAFVGLKITDTQTGLRAMDKEVIPKFLNVLGERFEYESNVLIECKKQNIDIEEVTIDTIYINGSAESHFNPIKDSIAISKLLFKYIFASLTSFVLNILLFAYLLNILHINNTIIAATIIAKVISSIYYYFISRDLFPKYLVIKYFILIIVQALISGFSVYYLNIALDMNPIKIKIIIDLIISILSISFRK